MLINGEEVGFAEDNGKFEFEYNLDVGVNEVIVSVRDPGGNIAEKKVLGIREAKSVVDNV